MSLGIKINFINFIPYYSKIVAYPKKYVCIFALTLYRTETKQKTFTIWCITQYSFIVIIFARYLLVGDGGPCLLGPVVLVQIIRYIPKILAFNLLLLTCRQPEGLAGFFVHI